MNSSDTSPSLAINNSPLEFAISGFRKTGRSVLVKSSDAQLDLIGWASETTTEGGHDLAALVVAALDSSRRWSISKLRSLPLPLQPLIGDPRDGVITFTFRGSVSKTDYCRLQALFERHARDILDAIVAGDRDQVEWAVGWVVAESLAAVRRWRRWVLTVRVLTALLVLALVVWNIIGFAMRLDAHFDTPPSGGGSAPTVYTPKEEPSEPPRDEAAMSGPGAGLP